jgi:serine protease Do
MSFFSTRPNLRQLVAASLLAGTTLGGLSAGGVMHALAQDGPKPGAIQPDALNHPLPDFVALVKQVKPAVVSITSKIEDHDETFASQGGGSPFGQQFPFPLPFPFGNQQMHHHTMEARGSGFIIDPDGTVVTNNHVVKDAKSVTITLDDGTTLAAKVIGKDSRTDIAVLKVKADHRLPFINLGDSDEAQPGSWVVAVGNPFGLGGTVTAGIVSARGRDIGEGPYDSFIQIDAPINQGNSGGPLFTQDGKVVGVNTAILSPNGGGSVGIGFAIPSNTVKNVVAQLEKSGRVTRGFIGVQAQAVTSAMAGALRLPASIGDERGALVASVEPDSPAGKGGVQPGDVIVAVNGHHVGNPRELAINISQTPPGTDAALAIYRDGGSKTVNVTIGTLQNDQASGRVGNSPQGSPTLGVGLQALTPQLRQQLNLPDNFRGAVITEVQPGSTAEQAGLQAGDVITAVGDKLVTSPAEATRAIRESLKNSQAVALRIMRDGQPAFVAVSPSQGDQENADGGDDEGK